MEKRELIKALRLEKAFKAYENGTDEEKRTVRKKFADVWGDDMAWHFLISYKDAEDLIWGFDSKNLNLFLEKF